MMSRQIKSSQKTTKMLFLTYLHLMEIVSTQVLTHQLKMKIYLIQIIECICLGVQNFIQKSLMLLKIVSISERIYLLQRSKAIFLKQNMMTS
jgi:hypothetical protein